MDSWNSGLILVIVEAVACNVFSQWILASIFSHGTDKHSSLPYKYGVLRNGRSGSGVRAPRIRALGTMRR